MKPSKIIAAYEYQGYQPVRCTYVTQEPLWYQNAPVVEVPMPDAFHHYQMANWYFEKMQEAADEMKQIEIRHKWLAARVESMSHQVKMNIALAEAYL